jgi:hypothetical protein
MRYIYYIDGEKFTTDNYYDIPRYKISSPDEQTPALENILTGKKFWCLKSWQNHRLTGPAIINKDGHERFYLNGIYYPTIREWINEHPNPDMYFDALGMNETDKILWFLQN